MSITVDEILQTFLAESEEDLGKLEQALLELEQRPNDAELVKTIFRVAHTLKSNAAALGFQHISEFAHALEELLDRVRNRKVRVDAALITLLLQALDGLRSLFARSLEGAAELLPEHRALAERFVAFGVGAAPPAPVVTKDSPRSPSPSSPGASPNPTLHALPVPGARGEARTLRVDVDKLDALLALSGEILLARSRLGDLLLGDDIAVAPVVEAHRESDRLYSDLQQLVLKLRLVPIGGLFRQFARTVRDVAESRQKHTRLALEGENVEVDMAVVEHLRDPLTHMIRNAIDHGIETPEIRRKIGKNPEARILLRAFQDGGSIVVQVGDDGAGLDRKRILERARARGLVGVGETPTEREIDELIFEPGFSTAEAVTHLSGRGVGMDVVRRDVEALHGVISIDSREGVGTTFTLRVPLTLTIVHGFTVLVGDEPYVLPVDSVVECLELPRSTMRHPTGPGVIRLREEALPYLRLREVLGVVGEPPVRENLLVVRYPGGRAGLVVDALIGESETVIRALGKLLRRIRGVAGSAILGSGRVALILDVPTLLRDITAVTSVESAAARAQ